MSERSDFAFARFEEQVAQIMGKPFADLLAVLAVETPGFMLPDGSPHPRYLEAMERTMMAGLRRALSAPPAPRSGPVN